MEEYINYLLGFHIAAGSVAFISAPIAIYFRNNATRHRPIGRVYFYAMLLVFLSAIILSISGKNVFLFLIAFFSFNFAWNGWRSIKAMKNKGSQNLDIYINYFALLFNSALIFVGLYMLISDSEITVGILSLVFGLIGFLNALRFNSLLKNGMKASGWLGQHITGMGAAYIATVTAFSATNLYFLPSILSWLLPTAIGSIVLSLYMRNFRKAQKA